MHLLLITQYHSISVKYHCLQKTLDLLAAAHSLVEQQVTLNNHSSKVAKKHCATIEELTTQLTSMKADYDVKCKQLDIETQSHENTVSDWKTQVWYKQPETQAVTIDVINVFIGINIICLKNGCL